MSTNYDQRIKLYEIIKNLLRYTVHDRDQYEMLVIKAAEAFRI